MEKLQKKESNRNPGYKNSLKINFKNQWKFTPAD
jgi:hypothetical protein